MISPSCLLPGAVSALALLLAACGTPAAKNFGGRWKPVNRFHDVTVEIPLAVPYAYYAAPTDGTLRSMLERWTGDTGMTLTYRLRSDFTLNAAVATIRTAELRDAATRLSEIYRPQHLALTVQGAELVVQGLPVPPPVSSAMPLLPGDPTPRPRHPHENEETTTDLSTKEGAP